LPRRFRMRIPVLALLATLFLPLPMLADTIYNVNVTLADGNTVTGSFSVGTAVPLDGFLTSPIDSVNLSSTAPGFQPAPVTGNDIFNQYPVGYFPGLPGDYVTYTSIVFESESLATGNYEEEIQFVTVSPTSSGPQNIVPETSLATLQYPGSFAQTDLNIQTEDVPPLGSYSNYFQQGATGTVTLASTPEPASLMLVASGLIGGAAFMRRRLLLA
jgi:hypothetical protein